ncbi:MAG: YbaK/EbsC family protein [bacterium]|nr:YbaK/EbsC family protein [bacterium]
MPKKITAKKATGKKFFTAKRSIGRVKKLPKKVISYLEKAGVPHEVIEHKTVYTAYDAAMTTGKKINEIAKSLLVKADKDYYVVILPADQNVNFEKLGQCIAKARGKDVRTIKIPGEKIMQGLLNIKDETVSAFGKLHKLPVIAEKNLTKTKKALFSSGGLNHSIEMKVRDFLNIEDADLAVFGERRKAKKAAAKKKKVAIRKLSK